MRTTVTINDELYRRAKARAALIDQPVGSVIEDALRALLDSHPSPVDRVPLPVRTGGGLRAGIHLDDGAALRAVLDEGSGIDALR
jgi:hypothetical protein